MEAKSVKEILIAAKWIIENVGWCQGSYALTKDNNRIFSVEEAYAAGDICAACSTGSIMLTEASEQLKNDAERILRLQVPDHKIVDWNDAPGRTREEVLAVFDRAIKAAGNE